MNSPWSLFGSPNSLSSSPHLKPQQSHSILTCMTTGIVHSTSLWPALQNTQSLFFPTSRRKKNNNKTHKHQHSYFFFLQWPGNIRRFITAARQQNLSFQLPKSCPLPSQKSLSQTTAQSQTNDFSIPILLSPTRTLIFHPALCVPLGITHPHLQEKASSFRVTFTQVVWTLRVVHCTLWIPNSASDVQWRGKDSSKLASDLPIALLWSPRTGEHSSPAKDAHC